MECDSYADSPVVGRNAKILWRIGKVIHVSDCTDELGDCENIPVVHAALTWDDPYAWETSILMMYNALYFKEIEVNLIPPIMIQLAGTEINECSKFLCKDPTERDHVI